MIRIQLLLLFLLLKSSCACLATVETSTTTLATTAAGDTTAAADTTSADVTATTVATTVTTVATTVTTVATTVTTAAATDCGTCTMDQVTIAMDTPSDDPNDAIPFVGTLDTPTTVAGCLNMVAVCMTDNPAEITFMEFQNMIGGPAFLNPVTATLVCNADGIWTYTESGVTTTVTELHCFRSG